MKTAMKAPVEKKNLLWMILFRLLIVTLLLALAVIIEYSASFVFSIIPLLYIVSGTYFLSGIYFLLYYWGKHLKAQATGQLFLDLLIITAFVYIAGGITSSASFLYIFPIIGAGFVLSNRALYLTASLSAILVGVLADLMYLGIIPYSDPDQALGMTFASTLYAIFIAWSAFFIIAFLVSKLVGRLRRTREALDMARKEIFISERLADAGRFSATMAHEIRNPLAAISGSIQVLEKELPLNPKQKELMEIVTKESKRVSYILEQFLDFAQPQKQTFSLISLPDLLDETLRIMGESGELNGRIKVSGNYLDSGIHYFGSAAQFKQVFWNIIKNAAKAMPDGGELGINFSQEEGNIRMQFADDGKGMTEEELEHLFEPFYSGFEGGRGLGLPLVRRIVENYGGLVQVKSELLRGTEVMIILPPREQPPQS
jgi:two-component system sensor histidine kinase PilS (NtrC family)